MKTPKDMAWRLSMCACLLIPHAKKNITHGMQVDIAEVADWLLSIANDLDPQDHYVELRRRFCT